MRFAIFSTLLAGCAGMPAGVGDPDLARVPGVDGGPAADLLPAGGDLSPAADLGLVAADLARTPADLAHARGPDLAEPACGAEGQDCCAGDVCNSGTCMRSAMGYPAGSGMPHFWCITAPACGGYAYPACSFAGDSWCERDPNAATDGNTHDGFYANNPCKP